MGQQLNRLLFTVGAFALGTGLVAWGGMGLSDRMPQLLDGQPTSTQMIDAAIAAVVLVAGLGLVVFGGMSATRTARRRQVHQSTISGDKVKERSDTWLRRNGTPLEARIIGITPTMKSLNGRKLGWEVTARALGPKRQKTYTFRSEPLDFNPDGIVARGDTISVMVDPDNPKQYWVDTAPLEAAFNAA